MFNLKPVGAQRLAVRLVYAFMRVEEVGRPIDIKVAEAEFKGMCKGANAVGFGHTESHVYQMVQDFVAVHPKPAYNATNSAARIAWENKAAEILGGELEASK
jgi:glucan phosphorylase